LHVWAEDNGYDVHEVETEIYKLATKFVKFLFTTNKLEITEDDVDANELKNGIAIEYEYTPDKDVAKRIAIDRLSKFKNYYSKLKSIGGD
jgi:hypothetical protein